MIPLGKPRIPDNAWKDIRAILASGQLVEGVHCRKFADSLSRYLDVPQIILVNSGTSALYLALRALNIGSGDSVLVPAYSFPATANVVAWTGAKPVFTDINPLTWNIDADAVASRLSNMSLTEIKSIKAIMPVQAFGNPVDMGPLLNLAKTRGWKIIEDAACALGSSWNGRACGTHGDFGCFSFHPRKILTTSEGGALVVRSRRMAEKLALLKNHGMIKQFGKIRFPDYGLNLRFTEVAAALGQSQMDILTDLLKERKILAERYMRGLNEMGMPTQAVLGAGQSNHQSLVARLPVKSTAARDRVFASLSTLGIQVTIGTYFLPALPVFRKTERPGLEWKGGHYPAAQSLFRQAISLPIYSGLGKKGVDQVLEGLRRSLP